jgi:hypothetical protein
MKVIRTKNLSRILMVFAAAAIWFFASPPAREAQNKATSLPFEKSKKEFFTSNCYMCHSADLKSGGLDLEQYQMAEDIIKSRDTWERVLVKLRTGEMPPKEMPRPKAAELQSVIQWIEHELELADRRAKPDPGRVTARRLNRAEYNNTIRDLLSVDFAPAEGFPQDDSGYGFDNIGDVLSVSPVLMEKYLTASERIARTALFGVERIKPVLVR